jgi:hypothetical protein
MSVTLEALDAGDHGILLLDQERRVLAGSCFTSELRSGIHYGPGCPQATLRLDVPERLRGSYALVAVSAPVTAVLRVEGVPGVLYPASTPVFDVPAKHLKQAGTEPFPDAFRQAAATKGTAAPPTLDASMDARNQELYESVEDAAD